MSKQETKAMRQQFRVTEKAVREILNQWKPIGLGTPDDEYDCLTHHILGVLQRGGSILDIKSTIQEQLTNHFGISDVPEDEINQTTNLIWAWWIKQVKE